jgi:hypothetical protein
MPDFAERLTQVAAPERRDHRSQSRQPRADVKFVSIWIQNRHAPQAGQAFVRGLLYPNALPSELLEPDVDVGHVQVNQAAYRTVAGVFSYTNRPQIWRANGPPAV